MNEDETALDNKMQMMLRRIRRIKKSNTKNFENFKEALMAIDDIEFHDPLGRREVALGVYGAEDWFFADLQRNRHLDGKPTLQIDMAWLVPSSFNLANWAEQTRETYTFFKHNRVIVQCDQGLLRVDFSRGKISVEHLGDPTWVKEVIKRFDEQFARAQSLIQWVYSTRGDETSVALNYRPAVNSAYPWLKQSINDYIDSYLDSQASVLILIGPPGTGKTTFIKNIIHRSGGNAKVAYDEKVMLNDGLFAGFIEDDSKFLVMEDADAFLKSRDAGNTMMHKFLNVSDGLISAADKKMIFSTNLPNINDIDSALMRPGRCFDVVEFRPLTAAEAQAVVDEVGIGEVPENKSHLTLAEIFSKQPSESSRRKKGIGFV